MDKTFVIISLKLDLTSYIIIIILSTVMKQRGGERGTRKW